MGFDWGAHAPSRAVRGASPRTFKMQSAGAPIAAREARALPGENRGPICA